MLQQKLVNLFARGSGTRILDHFAARLRVADKSEKIIAHYLTDLRLFGRCFDKTETMETIV